ncbi:MAG TPA: YegS/Rv2252/BmrU family lipid kinase [Patescibacteria group bacterium]
MEKRTKPIPLFLNTQAGAFKKTPEIEELTQLAQTYDIAIDVRPTTSIEDLQQQIQTTIDQGEARIAVAGGDGTVAAAVQVLAYQNIELGIIPTGTANNFATALRLPMDIMSAMQVLKNGIPQKISLGKANGRYFTEAAGVGIFADALALYEGEHHKQFFKGLLTLIRIFLNVRGYNLELEIDGQKYNEKSVMCTVANTFRIGYAFPVAPEAKLTDDQLDIVLVGDLKRSELLPYFRAMRAQIHPTLPKVTTQKVKTVTIRARRKLNVHADDQIIGTTPITIETHPGALTVLLDRL